MNRNNGHGQRHPANEGHRVLRIDVKIRPELYQLIAEAADEDELPMGQWLAQLAANHLKSPELGKPYHKRLGRPREHFVESK